jgi:MFS-type transporter involved in bile tolerance (Atg22 family)
MSTLLAEQNGQRIAIVAIAIFLFVGLVILFTVNESKTRQAAISVPSVSPE